MHIISTLTLYINIKVSTNILFAEESRFPSLAEEITSVAEALTGAPVHAKETVLKILERLTQRLDRAERDRDMAIGRYRELQARFEQLEEELSKKRGELRELLRQDSSSNRIYQGRADSESDTRTVRSVNGRYGESNGNSTEYTKKGPLSVIVDTGDTADDDGLGEAQSAALSNCSPAKIDTSLSKVENKSPGQRSEKLSSPKSDIVTGCQEPRDSQEDASTEKTNTEQKLNTKTKVSTRSSKKILQLQMSLA